MNLAFVSYETPFAPCGGIAAVMGRLPAQVRASTGIETSIIAPFHYRIEKMASLGRSHEGNFGMSFCGRTILVNIFRHDDKVPYYFLLPEDTQFFAGQRHPYDVPPGDLLRDSLFFGAAVARALHVIHPGKRWNLMLQDWEAATTALALADRPGGNRCFLTLHNSYDMPVSDHDLWQAGINVPLCPGNTVLQRALNRVEHPVFTVSDQFASDFTDDVLQNRIMAPHLPEALRHRLIGIDNGPFVDLAFAQEILAEAASGKTKRLASWKDENRAAFLAALKKFQPDDERPLWGNPELFSQDDAPWFVMAGRDDARQKGYDVAAQAATTFLEQGGAARFVFFPIPGDEGRTGLRFLENLAHKFPQSVLAFPFMFREGFISALRGATFGIMPSLYEPFGMAHEFYLNGTVGIGRATGGILQQIIPLRAAGSYSSSVATRAARWHASSSTPTGLLFRERDHLPTEVDDWSAINAGRYNGSNNGLDRMQERNGYPLFQSMAHELRLAIADGVRIHADQPELYFRMLTAGITHIQQNFSWHRAAQEYVRNVM